MDSAASTGSPPAVPARRQRWRSPRRDRPLFTRGTRRSDRPVTYQTDGSFGCGLVAEADESPGTCGGDLARRARRLDHELVQLARDDSAARRVLGRLARRFVEVRGWERLGFARLGDYAAERLGWSGRQLQEIARVAGALAQLPLLDSAFRRGILSWSKARLLACVASASDEARWLAVAASTDVRALAAVTASSRAAAREQRRLAQAQGNGRDDAAAADSNALDDEDQEERVLVRIACSRRARRMWNDARRRAPRLAGRALAQWEVAELVAAEASSSPGPFQEMWQQEPWRSLASMPAQETPAAQRRGHSPQGVAPDPSVSSPGGAAANPSAPSPDSVAANPSAPSPGGAAAHPTASLNSAAGASSASSPDPNGCDEVPSPLERELARLEELDAFALDSAMRRVRLAMQQRQSRLGLALSLFLDLRLHHQLGHACGADYVRERLGLSERTARELVRVAQAAQGKSPVLASAYARGELSPLRAFTLLPVVRPSNAAAWVERAGEVTLRRLADEVAWAAERAELDPQFVAAMPPAPGQDLGLDDDRQMCARDRARESITETSTDHPREEFWGITGRIHVAFVAPLSVGVLFRSAMQGFASPLEPRWKAFERMLEHVLGEWRRQPRHRNPVFARDGYRCSAPGCSSFANLHDHHIVPRSAGGSNDLGNRTTLCAWHHLRAVHGGLARATGQAPDAISWELGLAADRPPLLRLRGDRYLLGSRRGGVSGVAAGA